MAAAVQSANEATALLAVAGRLRRITLTNVTLADLRAALGAATACIAAEKDGSSEVLSDTQLCEHVHAGRLLHVLGPVGTDLDRSVFDVTSASVTSSQGVAVTTSEPSSAAADEPPRSPASLSIEPREAQVEKKIMQELQVELRLEREARRLGEQGLRRFAEELEQTCLGMVAALERRCASLELRIEGQSSELQGQVASFASEAQQQVNSRLADLEAKARQLEKDVRLADAKVGQSELEAKLAELWEGIGRLQTSTKRASNHLLVLLRPLQALQQGAARHTSEVDRVIAELEDTVPLSPPRNILDANFLRSSSPSRRDGVVSPPSGGARAPNLPYPDAMQRSGMSLADLSSSSALHRESFLPDRGKNS